jgi:hypothetical protein
MAYNTNKTTAPIRGLVNSGADLLKHMYDVKIYFPSTTGAPDTNPFLSYPITVRATGFNVPDIEVGTYDIKYHGVGIKRPNATLMGDRTFDIEFREDAAFDLRRRFAAWLMAVGDPVTGGVSNATQFFGKIEVGTIAGAYYATTVNSPNGEGKGETQGDKDIEDTYGHLTTRNTMNPLAMWAFYNVWVNKMTGIAFETQGDGAANTFTVSFQYMDMDYPQFGGNTLDLGANNDWKSSLNWTQKLE